MIGLIAKHIDQAQRNQAEAAFNEDYAEAALWGFKAEALEDLLLEVGEVNRREAVELNVVPING